MGQDEQAPVAYSLSQLIEEGLDPEFLRKMPQDQLQTLIDGCDNQEEWSAMLEYLQLKERREQASSTSSPSGQKLPE